MDHPMNLPLTTTAWTTGRIDWRTCAMALAFAALSLFLTTEANRFPSSYHPDEPSKARQVLDGEYNFHHPMLLLSTTKLIIALAHISPDADSVTIAGRWASALFTAGAVFCLVLLANLLAGPLAGFGAGCLLVVSHEIFEFAHYFKEDPALVFGISVFFVVLICYDRSPSLGKALGLGAALGLAISGKYVGAVVAPLAFWLIVLRRRETRVLPATALCIAGMLAVLALANLPVLANPSGFASGFTREAEFAALGHKGITRSVPHGVYWKVFTDAMMHEKWMRFLPVMLLLLGAFYAGLILRRREVRASEWMVVLFPIAFGILLSFFPKTHNRYFLPGTAVIIMTAALGAVTLTRFAWKGRPVFSRAWPACALIALAVGMQLPTFLAYFRGFHRDGRTAMAEYLKQHVPPGSVIAQDKRVDLDALKLPYDFRGKLFAAEVGTIDELRAQGIEYVAVAEGDYGRYLTTRLRPTDQGAEQFEKHRAFYQQLFREGKKLYECPAGTLQYLQPHIILYRLPPR